jgi:hypothetical protein
MTGTTEPPPGAPPAQHQDTARALRAQGASGAEARIRAALHDPAAHAEDLAAICNDRGLRDAALVLTAAAGGDAWDRLDRAARTAGRHALATGRHSAHGPITVLAAVAWQAGDPGRALALCRAVDPRDDAARLAGLLSSGTIGQYSSSAWSARMAQVPVEACLAHRSTPTPGTPAPARAAEWFAETQAPRADPGAALAARGWSLHVHQQIDLGTTVAWIGELRHRAAPVGHVVDHGQGGAPLVRFTDPGARRAWRDDLADTRTGEEAAVAALDLHTAAAAAHRPASAHLAPDRPGSSRLADDPAAPPPAAAATGAAAPGAARRTSAHLGAAPSPGAAATPRTRGRGPAL